jgi:hypothetical protein
LEQGVGVTLPASALPGSPKQANTMPATPTPNCFSAARRVTDWANPLVSSSNWWFITSFCFGLALAVHLTMDFIPFLGCRQRQLHAHD